MNADRNSGPRWELVVGGVLLGAISIVALAEHAPYSWAIIPGALSLVFIFIVGFPLAFAFYFFTSFFVPIALVPDTPFTLNKVAGIILIVTLFRDLWSRGGMNIRTPFLRVLLPVYLYIAFTCLNSEDPRAGLHHLFYLSVYFFMALLIGSYLKDRREVHMVFWFILLLTLFSALVGFFEFVSGIDLFYKSKGVYLGKVRINAMAKNPIVFAFNCMWAFPFCYYLFSVYKDLLVRFAILGATLFINLVALLTFNRQTFILVFVVTLLSVLLFRNPYSRLFLILLIIGILLISPIVLPIVIERFASVSELRQDASLMLRLDGLRIAFNIIKEKPFFGIGFGNYPTRWYYHLDANTYRLHFDKPNIHYPDFGYSQMLSETGVVGLLISIYLLYYALKLCIRTRREAGKEENWVKFNYASTFVTLLVIYILTNFIQDTFLYVRTWLMWALILALSRPDFLSEHNHEE